MSPAQVGVAQKAQGGAGVDAAQAGHEVRSPGRRGEQLALEPGGLEHFGKELLNGLLVAGRVRGVEADQPLEELGRPLPEA